MKDQLELKHLAPYLPYGLTVILGTTERNITAVSIDSRFVFVDAYKGSRDKQTAGIENIKPILRPLSDLTKEIVHNGEKFVFSDVYLSNTTIKKILGQDCSTFNNFLNDVDYNSIQFLFKYHLDVFGLIDKGLAISYKEAGL
ncbi:hypothetical protein EDC17_101190 [Sphingobacterium alimentarium]|uniref:Uncharacterized protein n=1 Tax=Sphingobacterium alimentarium TaxID=797292 RepID=A0A4R3W121_9SPHI|nr:hypothetical protein [Sphingobacterium alimentarium]TCV17171.1 hypothetical protein EDC17_101190 [Sphingobacterium alimentarium]